MSVIRLIGAVAALVVATPVFATATPITTTYLFDSPTTETKYNPYGSTTSDGKANASSFAGLQGTGDYTTTRATGSYFGNVLTFAATSGQTSANSTVQVSAYAGTGYGSGYYGGSGGTIENAVVTQYSNNLAITSRNSSQTGNNEFTCASDKSSCTDLANSPDYQHAIDNTGAFETLLLKFNSAVNLTSLTIGFPSAGSGNNAYTDATLFYYKGSGDPTTAMLGQTYAQLVSSGNWGYTNVMDISGSTCGAATDCATVAATNSAQYWMIGAFINNVGSNASLYDGSNDYLKIRGITTSRVPEPGTVALMGIAGAALVGSRRRRKQSR